MTMSVVFGMRTTVSPGKVTLQRPLEQVDGSRTRFRLRTQVRNPKRSACTGSRRV